ncbi:MAG: hypothetical protein OK422_04375 [Thaumarchaeota archaeon]|nr:hypothetical protein [Nitrososphaerota archaeon]
MPAVPATRTRTTKAIIAWLTAVSCDTNLVLGNSLTMCYKPVTPNLATKGRGKFVNRPTTTGGKKYDKFFVYVPTEVAKDSQFPFSAGEVVEVKIDVRRKLVVVGPAP